MLDLFRYEDEDGDELILRPSHTNSGAMMFHCDRNGARQSTRVPRDVALRLHQALGEWLFPVAPGTPNTTLLEAMVKKAAEDAVTAVLPLHLKSMTVIGPECGEHEDPSPHDVGHPAAPAPFDPELMCARTTPEGAHLASRCTMCGHLWVKHTPAAEEPVPEDHGRLMSELPRRTRPRGECDKCGHSWTMHPPSFGVSYCAQYTNAVVCGCSEWATSAPSASTPERTRPRTTVAHHRGECTCQHEYKYGHNESGCTLAWCNCLFIPSTS